LKCQPYDGEISFVHFTYRSYIDDCRFIVSDTQSILAIESSPIPLSKITTSPPRRYCQIGQIWILAMTIRPSVRSVRGQNPRSTIALAFTGPQYPKLQVRLSAARVINRRSSHPMAKNPRRPDQETLVVSSPLPTGCARLASHQYCTALSNSYPPT
jgi:hypothetical protein